MYIWLFTADKSSFKQRDRQCQGIFFIKSFGILVQAVFDHKFRFVQTSLFAPRGAHDITAFR